MAAVKMVNIFMVTQLLKKDSDIISATDNDGRTAVHWAAMVDNLDALRMLVSRGPDTIKDTQDCKVGTTDMITISFYFLISLTRVKLHSSLLVVRGPSCVPDT